MFTGGALSRRAWTRRHRVVLTLLWLHLPVLYAAGVSTGHGSLHVLVDTAGVALFAVAATLLRSATGIRPALATVGLLGCSALLVHFFEGAGATYLHGVSVLAVLTLYRSWRPFAVAVAFVVLHQGAVGVLESVVNDDHHDHRHDRHTHALAPTA